MKVNVFALRSVLLTSLCLLFPCVALAQTNVTGNWTVQVTRNQQIIIRETWTLQQANGSTTVTGGSVRTQPGNRTGALLQGGNFGGDGVNLIFRYSINGDPSSTEYFSNGQFTNANRLTGAWADFNNPDINGTWLANRIVPPTPTPSPTRTASPTPTKRPAAVSVSCQRGPAAKDDLVCSAIVGGFDSNPPAPSGAVMFSAPDGTFRQGTRCNLVADSASANSAICGVVYAQTSDAIKAKAVPALVASYSGDKVYASSQSQVGTLQVVETKLPKKTKACFSESEQMCQGVNVVLAKGIGKSGLGKISLKYFAPVGLPDNAPATMGVSISQLLPPLTPPRSASDVKLRVSYVIRPSENAWYKPAVPLVVQNQQPRGGVQVGRSRATVRYGQTKQVSIRVPSPAKKVISSAVTAQVPQVKVRVKLEAVRKGERRAKVFNWAYFMETLLDNR